MKKLISLFTVLLFILSGCLWFSTDTYADETKSSDSETAASETVPETQASPVILPTDKVSTLSFIPAPPASSMLIPVQSFIIKIWTTGIIRPVSPRY